MYIDRRPPAAAPVVEQQLQHLIGVDLHFNLMVLNRIMSFGQCAGCQQCWRWRFK